MTRLKGSMKLLSVASNPSTRLVSLLKERCTEQCFLSWLLMVD
jgi:hypothetical protein